MIRTKWVAGKLHSLVNRIKSARLRNFLHRAVCFLTGHPVDVMTGKVLTEHVDFQMPGPIPFKFERVYYSTSTYEGPLGHGWHHSYDQHIRIEKDGIVLRAEDGREIDFDLIEEGQTTRNPIEALELTRTRYGFTLRTKDRLQLYFGPQGRADGTLPLLRIVDLNGNTISLNYDKLGHLVEIIDSAGRHIRFINDVRGRLVALNVPRPEGEGRMDVASFEYDEHGDLVAAYDALGHAYRYQYKYHLLVQETNRNGLSFYFEYDGIDEDAWCVRTWGDGGIYDHVMTYDKEKHITVVEDSLGAKTVYYGNEFGLVTKIIDALGGEKTFEWDEYCRKTAESDQLGRTFRYTYDDKGNTVQLKDTMGTVTQFDYNNLGLGTILVDPAGAKWERCYDNKGNLLATIDPEGNRIQYMRDQQGRLLESLLPNGGKDIYRFQVNRNGFESVRFIDPAGTSRDYTRDNWGRLVRRKSALGQTVDFDYDAYSRLTEVRLANGSIFRYEYDPEGNLTHAVQPTVGAITFGYSGNNKLAKRVNPDGRCLQFKYNTEGKLVRVINEKSESCELQRDLLGFLKEIIGFDDRKRIYQRNAAGELIGITDAAGRKSSFEKDMMGRLVAKTGWDGETASYEYDPFGRLTAATNSHRRVQWERNVMGRVIQETQDDLSVDMDYDALGNRRSRMIKGPDFEFVSAYSYDVAGRLIGINADDHRVDMEWSPERQLVGLAFNKKTQYTQTFDEFNRITSQALRASDSDDMLERIYIYDKIGNLVKKSDSQRGESLFTYDRSGRLVGAEVPEVGRIAFSYDVNGNLIRSGNGETLEIEAGDRFRATERMPWEYDLEGNLIFRPDPGSARGWCLKYDSDSRLRHCVRHTDTGTEDIVEFAYDAVGRRIWKRHGEAQTSYYWDGYFLAAEVGGKDGNDPVIYHFQPDSQYVPLLQQKGTTAQLFANDHLGVPQELLDETGRIGWSGTYHPFGELVNEQYSSADLRNPFRFPGQYFDLETGLCHNGFRYYDPSFGRYITPDPVGLAGGINHYAYALNPMLWIDPLGLYDLALGLTRTSEGILREFADSHNASTWTDFFDGTAGSMESQLRSIIDGADNIHFNLTDLDIERALRDGPNGPSYRNITNWELYHITENWDRFENKVTFWESGEQRAPPGGCS
ncbi:MAG: RHS repeat-associated core domain-containing protein [bacterium]|nr:RHS repeat-associated core domain-containing protein [bacterium]